MKVVTVARLLKQLYVDKDPEAGLYLISKIGRMLLPNYRFGFPQVGWWLDEPFNDYLARFGETEGHNSDRRWMVYQLLRLTQHLPGDTAECGVFQGAGSYLVCTGNRHSKKTHHIFDSFEGLSTPGARDGTYWREGVFATPVDLVKKNLEGLGPVEYHKGWIPDRFVDVESKQFSFVHVDVDLEQPTLDSFAFFYPRMVPGGVLLCDDYGFTTCPGATRALDEFFADKPEKMVPLSGGSGFIIKGTPVGPTFDAATNLR